jgi:hypothetical protein
MAKGTDSIKATIKLEGSDMGPVSLNLNKTSTLSVAGGNSGVASANIATTGVDIVGVSQATTGTTYVYVCNTGTTAILVQSAAADGSTFTTIGSIGASEFGFFPFSAATIANCKIRLETASGTSTCTYAIFEMA